MVRHWQKCLRLFLEAQLTVDKHLQQIRSDLNVPLPRAIGSLSVVSLFNLTHAGNPDFVKSSDLIPQITQNFNDPAALYFPVVCIMQLWANVMIQHLLELEAAPLF